ncbi:hypothetical protein OC846_002338 [Tilletia horrida]|uniref:WD40 repeat-like protein n=1 Tax=Tilletia horrida TaxID=155126 RepID=A0AAN6GRH5_9BASI|nr:hypothetical protein OC845_002468 [Tilletia horrida]KAK0553807.1 hypothetical protein OC846_002338 [Tilletia horrida]
MAPNPLWTASATSSAAPLSLTLTWQQSPTAQPPRRKKQRRSSPNDRPTSLSYNGIPTGPQLDPFQAQLDADPWLDYDPLPSALSPPADARPAITAILPLSMERIVLALDNGSLALRSLLQLSTVASLSDLAPQLTSILSSHSHLRGLIVSLQQLAIPTASKTQAPSSSSPSLRSRTGSSLSSSNSVKIIIGTTDQGEVLIWDAATLTLFAELPLFTSPVDAVLMLDPESATSSNSQRSTSASRLNGCLACAASDGTLAILHLDIQTPRQTTSSSSSSTAQPAYELQVTVQHTIPSRAASAPLKTLFLRNAELLLLYDDGRARLWDTAVSPYLASNTTLTDAESLNLVGGAELRRSIGADQALSLVEDDNKAFDALYASAFNSASSGAASILAPRPASMYTTGSSQGGAPSALPIIAAGSPNLLAPPSAAQGAPATPSAGRRIDGSTTPDPAPPSPYHRPRFAAASHAAQALLHGLNAPFHATGSRTASGTATPNHLLPSSYAGPVVPTQRWVAFDFSPSSAAAGSASKSSTGFPTAAAAAAGGGVAAAAAAGLNATSNTTGVLSTVDEDIGGALSSTGALETVTLRADLRRAIEAAAKALVPKSSTNPTRDASSTDLASQQSRGHQQQQQQQQKGKLLPNAAGALKAFAILRPILGFLLPLGGDRDKGTWQIWDEVAEMVGLNVQSFAADGSKGGSAARPRLGQVLFDRVLIVEDDDRRPPTSVSEVLTSYYVALGALLSTLSRVTGFHDIVDTLRHQYIDPSTQLPPPDGNAPIALEMLSPYFLDSSHGIRDTARHLLHSAFRNLPQPQIDELCQRWEGLLPSRQTAGSAAGVEQYQAITLLGLLGSQRYKLLPAGTLKDVAASITMYLHDPASAFELTLALELIVHGFATWQHYFDAMEVMRTLFWLTTNAEQPQQNPNSGNQHGGGKADTPNGSHSPHVGGHASHPQQQASNLSSSPNAGNGPSLFLLPHIPAEVRSLARRATLHIAGENTPLFMTTLSHDILHARSAAHCSATMRLVTFLVRQEPLILLANLPRLAEAVVKSLDPTVTAMRDAVMQAATVMISDLVHTYPSIDFHGKAQRLAVGTHEGACILYDVKTATRLYVLEGHSSPCDACSFSPDGRRLVTLSHTEGRALIWKVGQSFTSVLMPGTMPRQGGTDRSGAYKAIDFVVSDAALGQVARDPLGTIRFEWDGESSSNGNGVIVRLGEVSLSFSVA